jgi:hypothetical protein
MAFLDRLIEQQITAAMERGEFDDLPGRGRPLHDLDTQRSQGWFAEQMVRREHSRTRHERTQVEIGERRIAFWRASSLDELRERVVAANRHIAETNLLLEPEDRFALFDFSEVIATWRRVRPAG